MRFGDRTVRSVRQTRPVTRHLLPRRSISLVVFSRDHLWLHGILPTFRAQGLPPVGVGPEDRFIRTERLVPI